MPDRKRWKDLTSRQQALVLTGASIELALTITALADLIARPRETLRGSRLAWLPVLLVQPVGPVVYLLLGRRRGAGRSALR